MKLHVLVEDVETARAAVAGGATVVQLRLKGASTEELVARGAPFGELAATFVVNDDVEAAVRLGADGVHLGRSDSGAERALDEGPPARPLGGFGRGGARRRAPRRRLRRRRPGLGDPVEGGRRSAYGLDGLREICAAVAVPVVAIGGIDASNAADCIRAGAAGVAVIRAAADAAALRAAIDAAL